MYYLQHWEGGCLLTRGPIYDRGGGGGVHNPERGTSRVSPMILCGGHGGEPPSVRIFIQGVPIPENTLSQGGHHPEGYLS